MKLIYPEGREITEEDVIDWAFDILYDDVLLEHQKMSGCTCGDDPTRLPCRLPTERPTLQQAMELLEDRGVATFARPERGEQ